MKKYTWSFNRSDEVWNHDTFDTIEECIKNAIEECGYDVMFIRTNRIRFISANAGLSSVKLRILKNIH